MKKWILNGLLILFSAVFLVCGVLLANYYIQSRQQAAVYDKLSDMIGELPTAPFTPTDPPPATEPDSSDPPEEKPELPESPWVTVTHPETGAPVQLLPEFANLYRINPDIVGWIQIPGTRVDYPVMQSPDNKDYYLKRNFHKEYTEHGSIYAREVCDIFSPSDNITIYGHRMRDGSMFYDLEKYKQKSFWEENRYIVFNDLKERHTYEIFAVFLTTASAGKGFKYHEFVNAADVAHYNEFIATCKSLSLYDTGITPRYGNKLITLSTCEYSQTHGRLVVVARRIS